MSISELVGKTLTSVERGEYGGNDCITFVCDDGTTYRMGHRQDCCESVSIEDINGDFTDLIGTPVLVAEERSNYDSKESTCDDVEEWTFYTLRTIKGSVDIRWYGTSNGYYSTSADFEKVN